MTLFEPEPRSAPPGWFWCEGRDPIFVSGAKSQWWWKCDVCGWVGFSTKKRTTVPDIAGHLRR